MNPVALTAEEMLSRIMPARAALDAVVNVLSDAALARSPASGRWPPIGHLTHIAAWERMIVAHLRDGTDHRVVRKTPEAYAGASLDELNARIYELHRHDTAADARAEFAAAHRDIVRFIQTLTVAELAKPYWHDDVRTVAEKIAGDTYLHYAEHRGWILELVEGRP